MKRESFVNYFLEARGADCDKQQLMFTLRDLVVGGMETGTTFIRWAIVLLTNHVSVQERLQTEIDSVIGRQRMPTLDDRSRSVRQISSCSYRDKTTLFSGEQQAVGGRPPRYASALSKLTVSSNLFARWRCCSGTTMNPTRRQGAKASSNTRFH